MKLKNLHIQIFKLHGFVGLWFCGYVDMGVCGFGFQFSVWVCGFYALK